MSETTKCRACAAEVIWLKNRDTDKAAPIDARPTPGGNVVIVAGGRYAVLKKDEVPEPGTPRYTSHFATCRDAARFRAAKGK
jgi:hypothetical protein